MTVALGRELDSLKAELESHGFEVVEWNSNAHSIDALLYSGSLGIPSGVFAFENSAGDSCIGAGQEFFMLNVDNMTVEQISKALRSRLYRPLF